MRLREAIKQMLNDGEFPRIISRAKGQDKVKAKEFYEAIKEVNVDDIAIIPLIFAIRSVSVYQNVICYMETMEEINKDDLPSHSN